MTTLTLKAARERAGLTQDELARRSGIAQATISSLERGTRSNPTRDTQDRLADALGITPSSRLQFATPSAGSTVSGEVDKVGHEPSEVSR